LTSDLPTPSAVATTYANGDGLIPTKLRPDKRARGTGRRYERSDAYKVESASVVFAKKSRSAIRLRDSARSNFARRRERKR
jgi:hypothetical protein